MKTLSYQQKPRANHLLSLDVFISNVSMLSVYSQAKINDTHIMVTRANIYQQGLSLLKWKMWGNVTESPRVLLTKYSHILNHPHTSIHFMNHCKSEPLLLTSLSHISCGWWCGKTNIHTTLFSRDL